MRKSIKLYAPLFILSMMFWAFCSKENSTFQVKKTADILAYCGEHKKETQCIVGFALETEKECRN